MYLNLICSELGFFRCLLNQQGMSFSNTNHSILVICIYSWAALNRGPVSIFSSSPSSPLILCSLDRTSSTGEGRSTFHTHVLHIHILHAAPRGMHGGLSRAQSLRQQAIIGKGLKSCGTLPTSSSVRVPLPFQYPYWRKVPEPGAYKRPSRSTITFELSSVSGLFTFQASSSGSVNPSLLVVKAWQWRTASG